MKPRILVAREVFPEVLDHLRPHFEVDDNQADVILGVEGLKRAWPTRSGVMTAVSDPVNAEVIAAAPQLKAVCNFAVGYNNIDLAACTRAGIMATNTPGVLDDTTADLAWALLMATARHIQTSEHWLRAGHWQGFQA
jgi:gluconate 2-dehydrogenase